MKLLKPFLFIGSLFFLLMVAACGDDNELPPDEKETEESTQPEAPKITIVKPAQGAAFEAGNHIDIEVTVSPAEKVRMVDFIINEESKGYTEKAPFNFRWDATNITDNPPGSYTLKVKAETTDNLETISSVTFKLTAPTQAVTLNGTLKSRNDNSLLDGIEIILNEVSATTGSGGKFLLETALEAGHYSLKTTGSENEIPLLYGFDVSAPLNEEMELFTYRKPQSITAKPSGFIKGVSLFDAGPWMGQDLYPEGFSSTFERLNALNANLVTVFDPVFITVAGNDSVKMSTTANTTYPWDMLSTSQYENLTDRATANHLDFMWWFGVWPHDEERLDNKGFNEIVFSGSKLSDKFWDDWFSEYTRYLKLYAQIAESKKVKYISLGHGLNYATSPANFSSEQRYNDLWSNMINEIKTVFTGQLVYFGTHRPFTGKNYSGGNEGEYYEDEGYTDTFKGLFDAFGIILSNITPTTNPGINTIKEATLASLQRYAGFEKPLILWIWAPSADGAANLYGHLEPVLDVDVMANSYEQDFYEQADIYEGIMEAVNETTTNVKGIVSHGYMYHDRFDKYEPRDMNTAFEKAASVRGKPAEELLKYWYSKW